MTTKTTPTKKPAAKTAAKKPAPSKLAQAATKGDVKFYRRRANGTMRRVPYLAPGTPERQAAEAVVARRNKGETILAICEDLKLSKATGRRMITGVLFAQAVEAGDHDNAWDGKASEVTVAVVEAAV